MLHYVMFYLAYRTPAPPRGTSVPRSPSRPQPTRRSASVRRPSQTSGPSRTSSIIVHDPEEDGDELSEETMSGGLPGEKASTPSLVPPPRTRKAKEMQTRLGKGKPIIAGGSGPRAITASSGSSKGRLAKSSKTMKPREPTIHEGKDPYLSSCFLLIEVEPETLSATDAVIKSDSEEPIGAQTPATQPLPEPIQPSQTVSPFAANDQV